MDGQFRSGLLRYGCSVVAILLALTVRMLLEPYLGDHFPIVTFLVPVILIAWYGGLGPSILSIVIALLLADFFILEPRYSLWIRDTEDRLGFLLYAGAGVVMALFAQAWRKVERQTEISEAQYRRLAESLRESEERLRLVLEASATGWWYWDLIQDVVRADTQTKALFGLTPDAEVSFEAFLQALAPDEIPRVLEELPGAIRSTDDFESEFHLIWPDDSHHWVLARGRAFREAAGQPQRLMGLVMDISERKRAEEAVRESEEMLRMAEHAAHSGSFDWDIQTGWSRISPELSALYGVEPVELESKYETWARFVHPGDLPTLTAEVAAAFARHESQLQTEYRIVRRDGAIRWIECRGKVTYDPQGIPARAVGVNIDITERKEAERRLHEHMVQLQAITDHAHDFIVRFDRHLRHLFVNRALSEAMQIPLERYLGRTGEELGMPEDKVAFWNRHLRRVFETGQPERMEFDFELGGATRSFSSLVVPERASAEGTVETVLAITRDVTDAKRVEAALKSWNEELEARVAERTAVAEQRASQLRMLAAELTQAEQRERRRLAKILHDHLQQLLVAARMRLSVLHRHAPNEKVATTLQQIHELLDQCLVESRSLTVELSPPVLYEAGLTAGLQWLARQMEEKHHLQVEVDSESTAEPTCEAKRVFLFQAIRELLLNIVKHAQTDRARVELRPLDHDWLRLVVTDSGRGFDPARLEDRRESSGFGLFSIRERLEVLGGRMNLDTAPGQGTRTVIEVPRASATPPSREVAAESAAMVPVTGLDPWAQEARGPAGQKKTRVLLVDDHAIVRQGLAGMLREHDAIDVVGEAVDGQQAVEVARQIRPDVVLMDITMPRLNGIEATRRIVENLPEVRVIGLSMHEEADMATAMHKAGAVAYLSKDVASNDLFATILASQASGEA